MPKFFKFVLTTFIIINILFFSATICLADETAYVWSSLNDEIIETSAPTLSQEGNFLNLTSGSAILMEQKTGQILYEHNIHEQLRPASVTKIMTILLIMEDLDSGKISLTDKVPCSDKAASMGGSQIWLAQNEILTVDEMLKAICVVSANDCSVAMAEFLNGSEEAFVERMNQKAKELGMNDTCFKNCHGLDADGHLTSSYDIALMSKELMNNHPSITNYTKIWMDSLRNGESSLVSTNKLLRNYEGCTGLKTGSTSTALFNLSATATRNNLSLIAVVMRGETSKIRFEEAKKLLDYGFNNFEYVKYAKKSDLVKEIPVNKGTVDSVQIIFEEDAGSLIPKGKSNSISTNVVLADVIDAPINSGDIIGEVQFYIEDSILNTVKLVSKNNIKKLNLGNMFAYIIENWFNLLR